MNRSTPSFQSGIETFKIFEILAFDMAEKYGLLAGKGK
jgi:hypothetical protein